MDFRDIHLRVLYSFNYETKGGRKISITEGEKLFLIRKTNADWWQVIRNSTERPFFVPATYVQEIKYGEKNFKGSNSLPSESKQKTDFLSTDRCNTPLCSETDIPKATLPSSQATCTCNASENSSCKQHDVHSNLPSINERISSEKWRLWAAEELISELSCTASLHRNAICQRKTSEQSYLKTQPDNCANSLSSKDKKKSYEHKAHFVGTATSLDESLFPVKKRDTNKICVNKIYDEECQVELLQTACAPKLLNLPCCKRETFRLKPSGSCTDSGSTYDPRIIQQAKTEYSVKCFNSNNSDGCVPVSKNNPKEVGVIPESHNLVYASDTSDEKLLYGSSKDLEISCSLADSLQDLESANNSSVCADMFSKMKSKLKYSASFKTKRELKKLSEKTEGNSVLSSSWDKLDNLKTVEDPGLSVQGNFKNINTDDIFKPEDQKGIKDLKKDSASVEDNEPNSMLRKYRISHNCTSKQRILKSDSECDCNANYTIPVKEKAVDEEFSEFKTGEVKSGSSFVGQDTKDWSDSEHSEDLLCLSDETAKSQKISSSCETIDDWRPEENASQPDLADVVSIPLPDGWVESYDEELDVPCYVHEQSGDKWYSSNDAEGRVYFYQENSSESSWRLPEVPTIMLEGTAPEKPSSTESTKEKEKPTITISSDDSQIRHQNETENRPVFRMAKARSMVLTDTKSKEGSPKSSSVPRNYLPVWDGTVHTLKEGILNKTKMWETGGKKVRKNWSLAYVVLSKFHLLFFKDMKTYTALKSAAATGNNSSLPDMCIDLKGALVEEAEKLSSRRYVFAVTTIQGLKVLLQCDDKLLYTDWYHAVRNAIRSITEESGLRNSSSTKDVGSYLSQAVSPNQNRKILRIDRSRSVKSKNKEGSLEDLASSPDDQQIGIHTRLKYFFLRRPLKEALEQRGILKNEAVFGCHLPDVCYEDPYIPLFVLKCVQVIESKDENMKTVGLYRASGNLSQVQKIRLQVNQDNYKALEEEEDVHVLTGALKLFFRELKEPVIPCRMFSRALDASSKSNEEEKLKDFQEIVKSLPKPNRCTLEFLLKHLLRVTEYKADNQMSIHTLAIVFGPSLMWPEEESQNIAFDYMMQNVVIEFLLKAFQNIFDNSCDNV